MPEQSAESFTTIDDAVSLPDFVTGNDQRILQPLVVPLSVEMLAGDTKQLNFE